ncbi:hypothetical protein SMGD1_0612 [Sulfurimonas gotlandica GD1]|uniref:Lcl C-terminal domain-containing protein n=2 Tax=Sulfurimonas TaxID=202746 RepID=B6BKS9_SULGG|nr:DUF1566 domain-containing protein [Sulfurimonas gotlandica]EDZ62237.1 conserved domain protein [Sulfurimonas gotlandica GD1]EHP29139.1 hypothetical protein SMGD1_0612 [Sulfurimonas gotlandica GD1]
MIKKLLLIVLISISAFGVEIVIDKTVKKLDIKKSTLKRDDVKEVVKDITTGLMWQDDSRAKSVKKDWNDAKEYCQNLSHGGYNDWYLPTIIELESIADYSKVNPAIKEGFKNVTSSNYWSSSVNVPVSEYAWYVYFDNGYSLYYRQTSKYYVRCARAGQ